MTRFPAAVRPRQNRVVRAFAAVVVFLGVVWATTAAWPADTTAHWQYAAEAQASWWVGAALAIFGAGAVQSWRRAFIYLLIFMVAVVVLPRVPISSLLDRDATPTIRVLSLNTHFGDADEAAVATMVEDIGPDVLFLSETNTADVEAVAAATAYMPLTQADPGDGGADAVVALVRPGYEEQAQATAELVQGVTRFQMPSVRVVQDAVVTHVAGVHAVAPIGADRGGWDDDLRRIGEWAAQRDKLVLAGDFNATRGHPRFRDIDLQSCTGHLAHTPTWPAPFPVIRLDHILTTGQCFDAGMVAVPGTDHRGVWADVSS